MRLRDLREDHDLYENGQRQVPVEVLIQLARFYHTSVDYLLGLTDVRQPYARCEKTSK